MFAEHIGVDGGGYGGGDLGLGGPDVFEVDRGAGLILAQRLGGEVVTDVTGEGVGDDQRGRHEVVGSDFRGDAALEVAVAGEDRDGDEGVDFNCCADIGGQGAGVSDAGGTTIPNGIETECVEVGC